MSLDLILNLVQFVFEALVSYASTPEGSRHLAAIEKDLGMVPQDQPATRGASKSEVEQQSNVQPLYK